MPLTFSGTPTAALTRCRTDWRFAPEVLATFEREPELIDVAAHHLLERHFAPGLHEEILQAVGLELGTPVATRRRAAGFRAAVLQAYLAECGVCGFLPAPG